MEIKVKSEFSDMGFGKGNEHKLANYFIRMAMPQYLGLYTSTEVTWGFEITPLDLEKPLEFILKQDHLFCYPQNLALDLD
jgi:hypothetical protein